MRVSSRIAPGLLVEGHVVVDAHEDALALDVDVTDGLLLLHGVKVLQSHYLTAPALYLGNSP